MQQKQEYLPWTLVAPSVCYCFLCAEWCWIEIVSLLLRWYGYICKLLKPLCYGKLCAEWCYFFGDTAMSPYQFPKPSSVKRTNKWMVTRAGLISIFVGNQSLCSCRCTVFVFFIRSISIVCFKAFELVWNGVTQVATWTRNLGVFPQNDQQKPLAK